MTIWDEAQRTLDALVSGTYTMSASDQLRDAQELMRFGSTWKRYYLENDKVKVDPITHRAGTNDVRTLLDEAITRANPPRPWFALPQPGRRTVAYLAVQMLLDSYVN